MTNNGWIVIRFSEEQIFQKTKECIDFISYVIHQIEKGEAITVPDNLVSSKWTIEEAAQMAYKHQRDTYIDKRKLKRNIYINPDDEYHIIDGDLYLKLNSEKLTQSDINDSITSIKMETSSDGTPMLVFYDGASSSDIMFEMNAHWNVTFVEGGIVDRDSVFAIEYINPPTGKSVLFAYGEIA